MSLSMSRLILYVHDVERLKSFYQAHFDLTVVEEIAQEWVVLQAGTVQLALHRIGKPYRGLKPQGGSNTKIVFDVPAGLEALRDKLIAAGVAMRPLKRFDGFAQLMCDGEDPEGNVFQLSQPDA
ncbi:MAG: VOC family protein [Burkholderiales bacterium]|nr:VOC family protein [Burkholderiales bacterium]